MAILPLIFLSVGLILQLLLWFLLCNSHPIRWVSYLRGTYLLLLISWIGSMIIQNLLFYLYFLKDFTLFL